MAAIASQGTFVLINPSAALLIQNYLRPKIAGSLSDEDSFFIKVANVYAAEPSVVIAGLNPSPGTGGYGGNPEWYFFTNLCNMIGSHNKKSRTVGGGNGGYWKSEGKKKPVKNCDGGFITKFFFLSGGDIKTEWRMTQYSTAIVAGAGDHNTVLCKVQKTLRLSGRRQRAEDVPDDAEEPRQSSRARRGACICMYNDRQPALLHAATAELEGALLHDEAMAVLQNTTEAAGSGSTYTGGTLLPMLSNGGLLHGEPTAVSQNTTTYTGGALLPMVPNGGLLHGEPMVNPWSTRRVNGGLLHGDGEAIDVVQLQRTTAAGVGGRINNLNGGLLQGELMDGLQLQRMAAAGVGGRVNNANNGLLHGEPVDALHLEYKAAAGVGWRVNNANGGFLHGEPMDGLQHTTAVGGGGHANQSATVHSELLFPAAADDWTIDFIDNYTE